MNTTDSGRVTDASTKVRLINVDMKLEVGRHQTRSRMLTAPKFYGRLGWRLDQTPPGVGQFHAARLLLLRPIRREPHAGAPGSANELPSIRLRHPRHP